MLKKYLSRVLGRKNYGSGKAIGAESQGAGESPLEQSDLEVILIDESELAVIGEDSAVEAFLLKVSETNPGKPFSLEKAVQNGTVSRLANVTQGAIESGRQHGRWIKLTEESAKQVRASGLIPTPDAGVSYLSTGKPGAVGPWLKGEAGSISPTSLASAAAIVAQLAMSSELAAMREMLQNIDRKLDAIARQQRDLQLAKLDRVAFAIQDAKIRADAQGGSVNSLTWSRVQGESGEIDEAQGVALRAIEYIIETTRAASLKELGKLSQKLGQDSSVWMSVLGRTLELRDELAILEFSMTETMDPDEAFRHRASVRKALDERRRIVGSAVAGFSKELRALSPVAYEAVVLHAPSSRKLVGGLNIALEVTNEFGKALGEDLEGPTLEPVPWIRAALDREQRKAAVTQVVDPIVETAKGAVQATKDKVEEIRDEIKRRGN